jgi:hypothetical protein
MFQPAAVILLLSPTKSDQTTAYGAHAGGHPRLHRAAAAAVITHALQRQAARGHAQPRQHLLPQRSAAGALVGRGRCSCCYHMHVFAHVKH